MDGVGRVMVDADATPAEAPATKRTRKRDSLFLSASLRLDGDDEHHEVRVRNLSAGGLMAELDRTVEPGTAVALEMRGLGKLSGTVAWCTRGRLGIALDHPIDPARARKPVGTGATTPAFAKPLVVQTRRG
jgi:hypothetical protein